MNLLDKVRAGFLKVAGYFIPILQSIPSLGVWTGLMTVPFITYLIFFFASLPSRLIEVLFDIGFWILIIGLLPLAYSIAYQSIKKKGGLVTTGPYRWVRHPQYLIIIFLTMMLTVWSYWFLTHTFGIGFLSPSETISLWFLQLFAYVILAKIEELYLSKKFGTTYEDYRNQVPFLIPFLKTDKEYVDVSVSILLLAVILFAIIIVIP
ncbi:MAG: methyltransferase family protein [Candidatus Hermodarchaeota archaeon]